MAKQIQKTVKPDYKKIYTDIIEEKCPERLGEFREILSKSKWSVLDIIEINQKIFNPNKQPNQKFRAYDKPSIWSILEYQKENNLKNYQIAQEFSLSRNTIAKWKKIFF